MSHRYYSQVAVGHLNGIAYRSIPNTSLLAPTQAPNSTETRHIYYPSILGLNKEKKPKSTPEYTEDLEAATESGPPTDPTSARQQRDRRKAREQARTDETTQSADSTLTNDRTGFAFYQLGALKFTPGLADATSTDLDEVMAKEWFDTGFVLVVTIETNNRAGDVYILSNIRPEGPETGERWPVEDWGCLAGGGRDVTDKWKRRAGARIARSFMQLGANFELQLPDPRVFPEHEINEEFELVRCVQVEDKRVVRLI